MPRTRIAEQSSSKQLAMMCSRCGTLLLQETEQRNGQCVACRDHPIVLECPLPQVPVHPPSDLSRSAGRPESEMVRPKRRRRPKWLLDFDDVQLNELLMLLGLDLVDKSNDAQYYQKMLTFYWTVGQQYFDANMPCGNNHAGMLHWCEEQKREHARLWPQNT
ncbi:MAG: hypothetical protein M3R24_39430 [Chloroflexota bacterium]|nr:hypothetical protein [Chloroflexota bacterium]